MIQARLFFRCCGYLDMVRQHRPSWNDKVRDFGFGDSSISKVCTRRLHVSWRLVHRTTARNAVAFHLLRRRKHFSVSHIVANVPVPQLNTNRPLNLSLLLANDGASIRKCKVLLSCVEDSTSLLMHTCLRRNLSL